MSRSRRAWEATKHGLTRQHWPSFETWLHDPWLVRVTEGPSAAWLPGAGVDRESEQPTGGRALEGLYLPAQITGAVAVQAPGAGLVDGPAAQVLPHSALPQARHTR
jgi:hypothetical protein